MGSLLKWAAILGGGWFVYDRFIKTSEVGASSAPGMRKNFHLQISDDVSAQEFKAEVARIAATVGLSVRFDSFRLSSPMTNVTDATGVLNLGSATEAQYQAFLRALVAAGGVTVLP